MNTKKLLVLTAAAVGLGAQALAVQAEELARVVSATPVLETTPVQREVCTDQQVFPRRSGAVSAAEIKSVRTCNVVTNYESRPVAWNVIYEYAGKQYAMQTATDPGSYIRLQLTPLG